MTTFSSYQSLRADLSANCNLLETAWREATRSTEMEDFLGAGVSDGRYNTSSRRRLVGISAIGPIPRVGGDVGRIGG